MIDREAARLASLKRQREIEAQRARGGMIQRVIYPVDYTRRELYYMGVDLYNAGLQEQIRPIPPEK